MKPVVESLLTLAKERGLKISTAESCTGGLISAGLTEVAGSSAVFEYGFVTYANKAKIDMLGVTSESLEAYGAVSEQVAGEMALGALDRSSADIAVSVTGIAGPGGSEFKPEGRVCFGLAQRDGETITQTVEFGAIGRENVRKLTTQHALKLLLDKISN
jgi:nicotinamide-nucleotide amidase